MLVAGFIYYMFDPIVVFLEKHRIPSVRFLLTFLVVIILVVLTVMNVVPQLMEQTIQLTQSLPTYADETSKWLNELAQREEFKNFNLEEQLASANLSLSNLFNIILVSLSASVSKIISFMMQFLFCYLPFHLFCYLCSRMGANLLMRCLTSFRKRFVKSYAKR
ncbi:AI-2E family transporter [Enterococcus faecium]|nr:AI-2E family transporter [Enterococcus faecium]